MPAFICDARDGLKYLVNDNGHYSWTKNAQSAVKFSSKTTALNFMRCNFPHVVKNVPIEAIVVLDGNGEMVPAAPETASETEAAELAKLAEAAELAEIENAAPAVEAQPVLPKVALDADTAAEKISRLFSLAAELGEMTGSFQDLMDFYTEGQRQADMETVDILHKIEFSKFNAVDGYRIYRQLHDVRLRRRACKDTIQMLNLFMQSGLWQSALTFRRLAAKQQQSMESRKYRPRVLDELFES